jgi:hypothetical protein
MKYLQKINKNIRGFLALLVVGCLIAGCASVDITKTSSGFYDPTDPNAVEILKIRPDHKFEELGLLTVTGFDSTETAKMHNAIRAKAAELGANAVILTEEGLTPGSWGSYNRWATGVAIRYTAASK